MQGHVYLGLSLHQTGFIDQAQKHFEAAKVISDKLEEFNERNIILVGLAHLYHDRFIRSGKTDISMFNAAEEYYQTTARKTEKAGDKYRYARTLLYQSQLYLSAGMKRRLSIPLKESQQIFRVLEHHYNYSIIQLIYLGKAFKEAGRYENLKFYVEDGIGEALRYRFPYHRHLSELRFLKALVLCHNRQGQDTMRQLAHCLVDAILFNRFQCEKIADQLVVELEKDSYLRNEVARTKGRHLQVFFDQRIRRDKNSQTHSQKQEKLVVDVTDWLKELGQNPSAKFPKRAHADVQILLEDADI